ncbi:MAG TPA: hypothetical protein DDX71_02910 [Ruminococcus sp.]|nr:hypothetical protein [Ruminococcus sp.]
MQKAIRIAGLLTGEGAGIQTVNRTELPFRLCSGRAFCAPLHRYRRMNHPRFGKTCAVWLWQQADRNLRRSDAQPEKEKLS